MANVIVKSLLGFAFLMLVLALTLFLSAGSFAYRQAWIYLCVFAACTVLITAYLLKYDQKLLDGRVKAGPIAETQKAQKVIQSLASLFFIGLFVVSGLDFRFHWSNVPFFLSVIAEGLVSLGFFLVFLVFRENSFSSAVIEVSDEQKVVTSGPYSAVRHPMYAGASILLLGTPPALGSWIALPFPLLLILVIAVRSIEEEKLLSLKLSDYEEYCRKVRFRLLPFVW